MSQEKKTPLADAINLIRGAQNILLLSHTNPDGDGIGACLALNLALVKMGKRATSYAEGIVPETFSFLPHIDLLTDKISSGRDFIISVNTSQTEVEKVQFQQHKGHLDLILSPIGGTLSAEDINCHLGEERYDLVITSDVAELKMLGKIKDDHRHLLQHTPVINIDHHSSNDRFGNVNLVDVTAASSTEIVYRILEQLDMNNNLIDEDIATCILNGLITDTGSFQHSNTTPRSFELAAQLLAAGARQQDIIRHVFKTKELSTLKLWGQALSNLHEEKDIRMVWTALSREDFHSTDTEDFQANGLIDELLSSAPEAAFVMLIREEENGNIKGSMRSVAPNADVAHLCGLFGGGGHTKAAGFKIIGGTLEKDTKMIVDKIREELLKEVVEEDKETDPDPDEEFVLPQIKKEPLEQR